MNLQPIIQAQARCFRFLCAGCGNSCRSEAERKPMVDTEGPAFRSYYCTKCAAERAEEQRT